MNKTKGKKFDAAERHFKKKRVELYKRIDHYKDWAQETINENRELKQTVCDLESENAQLKEWIERLLEYTELDKDDVIKAFQQNKKSAESVNSLVSFFGKVGMFY